MKIFFLQIYTVDSNSMYKTILPGNKVIINKLCRLKKGDIILFTDKTNDQISLSRLIAEDNDTVLVSDQNVFVNNEKLVFLNQTKSYCFRFIRQFELESLKKKYTLSKLNNSGFYRTELTQFEYDEIINDSSSDLRFKVFPIKKCNQSFFSPVPAVKKIVLNKDSVFVLNDNRSNLYDSRTLGLISKKDIKGKKIYTY